MAEIYGPQIESIARDEMRHLKWLAHTVVHFRGIPDLSPREISPPADLVTAIREDIGAENQAITQYEEHIDRIEDTATQALLRRIVVDEKDHRRQFEDIHSQLKDQAWSSQVGSTQVSELATHLQALLHYEYRQVLEFLFGYFVHVHGPVMGMGEEDWAIDEMKHLGWVAEWLVAVGGMPSWQAKDPSQLVIRDSVHEQQVYEGVLRWAQDQYPQTVPLIERIMQHEQYQMFAIPNGTWTVGSLKKNPPCKGED